MKKGASVLLIVVVAVVAFSASFFFILWYNGYIDISSEDGLLESLFTDEESTELVYSIDSERRTLTGEELRRMEPGQEVPYEIETKYLEKDITEDYLMEQGFTDDMNTNDAKHEVIDLVWETGLSSTNAFHYTLRKYAYSKAEEFGYGENDVVFAGISQFTYGTACLDVYISDRHFSFFGGGIDGVPDKMSVYYIETTDDQVGG